MSVRRLAPPDIQPKDFSFNKDNLAWANEQVKKYPEGRQQSAIIPLLWRAQEQSGGWLPEKGYPPCRRLPRHGAYPRA